MTYDHQHILKSAADPAKGFQPLQQTTGVMLAWHMLQYGIHTYAGSAHVYQEVVPQTCSQHSWDVYDLLYHVQSPQP